MRLAYEVGGKKYEHDIEGHVIDGLENSATDDMPILWADPANPVHVEARGPGYWVVGLFLVGLVAAAITTYL